MSVLKATENVMGFKISSNLKLSADEVSQLLTMAGVNKELRPFYRMIARRKWADPPFYQWPTCRVLLSSWILLFGFIPIGRHQLPGNRNSIPAEPYNTNLSDIELARLLLRLNDLRPIEPNAVLLWLDTAGFVALAVGGWRFNCFCCAGLCLDKSYLIDLLNEAEPALVISKFVWKAERGIALIKTRS